MAAHRPPRLTPWSRSNPQKEEGTIYRITVLLGTVWLLMGWIVAGGSQQVVKAQETPGEQSARELLDEGYEWRMHSSATTARTWLYNAKTGKVYRVTFDCDKDAPFGCLVPLPVANEIRQLAKQLAE